MTKRKVQEQASRIPEFASREEMAEWFDTHDMADYQDEFKTVKVRFAKKLSEGINIRLDDETVAALRSQAPEKGIGPTTLARMWIMERLRPQAVHAPAVTQRNKSGSSQS